MKLWVCASSVGLVSVLESRGPRFDSFTEQENWNGALDWASSCKTLAWQCGMGVASPVTVFGTTDFGVPNGQRWLIDWDNNKKTIRSVLEKHIHSGMPNAAGSSALVCSEDLLPCPFCGRHAPGPKCGTYMTAVSGGTAVRCPTCNAHGPVCPTFDQAIEQWNKRDPNASNNASAVSR